jgi:hypothetical protein
MGTCAPTLQRPLSVCDRELHPTAPYSRAHAVFVSSFILLLFPSYATSPFIIDKRNWRKSELSNIYSHSADAALGNYYPIYPTVGIHCRSDGRYRANSLNTAPVPRYMNMYTDISIMWTRYGPLGQCCISALIFFGRCSSLPPHESESMLRTYLVCREKQANARERSTQCTDSSDPVTSTSELLLRQNSVTAHAHQS